jgi:hypothetical protein
MFQCLNFAFKKKSISPSSSEPKSSHPESDDFDKPAAKENFNFDHHNGSPVLAAAETSFTVLTLIGPRQQGQAYHPFDQSQNSRALQAIHRVHLTQHHQMLREKHGHQS